MVVSITSQSLLAKAVAAVSPARDASMLKVKSEERIFLTNLILFFSNFFLFFLISLSFTCVAAIGNLSEQAGFALKKRFGLFP